MSNMKKPLPKDYAEVAMFLKTRLSEKERKRRIFNPQTRTIGVSYYELLIHLSYVTFNI